MHSYLQNSLQFRNRVYRAGRGRATPLLPAALCLLALAIGSPPHLKAQHHLVSPAELQQHIQSASGVREADLRHVREFFLSETVEKHLPTGLDSARITAIVPFLDDAELARLAETTRAINRDLAAGALTNQQLTYIVIALGTAIVVILAT